MKFNFIIIFSLLIISSCKKPTALQKDFNCQKNSFYNTEQITDIKNKFKITVPKSWKTQLYFDNFQTEIYTADTIKQLSETYILDFARNNGELEINNAFKDQIMENLEKEQFENSKFKFDSFKGKKSIWFLSKGKKMDKTYHYFQLFVKNSSITYYEFSSKIYGDELVDERLCESIALIEKIEFLE